MAFRNQTAGQADQAGRRGREAFAQAVLDAIGANVAVLDRHGVITAVNAAWEYFARDNGDRSGGAGTGVGVNYLDVARRATGASSEGAAEALAGIQDVLGGHGRVFTHEYPCHSPSEQRWFMLRATPLADDAGGAVLAHIDITLRKQVEHDLQASETRYRRLFESAKDGILILDANTGQIEDVNPFLVTLLGYSHAEFVGKRLWEIGTFKDVAASKESFLTLQAKGYVRYDDLPLETKDGRRIAVEFVSNVYPVNASLVIQCNIRDITERQRARQVERNATLETSRMLASAERSRLELLNMMDDQKQAEILRAGLQAQLVQAQKLESIGTLAGGVAHEINNPIMGIMGYAQLIQDRLGRDNPLAEYAVEIGKESQRVAVIVKTLLSFARQDKEPDRSPARLCDIVEDTLSLIRATMRHDQLTLEVDVPKDLPLIECRNQQIRQVVMNLLTNARDALNQKYPKHDANKKILITARAFAKDGRTWLRTTVEDHGPGIPEELRVRIFDPFFSTKPRDRGTGLGLSISHSIVKDHGGTLGVESEVGQWTRFHMDLPVE
jgi:PAS domain S-box-containing protein